MSELAEHTGVELLALGDDALIAAQRLAEWVSRAPTLEEDVALANIALDQLGAARMLLATAGDEDELAYRRDDHGFRNCLLAELPLGPARGDLDFGWTMTWLLMLSAAQLLRYTDLAAGADEQAAGIGAKAVKESTYHLDHATQWMLRLGGGTEQSHRRVEEAVDGLWPYGHELTEGIRDRWLAIVEPVLAEAGLTRPADRWRPDGGRAGRHTEHLSYLLAEMQSLHRAHPGAQW
ncbi:1,2-phenylacetyl-CoA epoxidase subunit PaaC [Catellatospora chokoriensis]|uniref:Phenylacetate-CoA oxygenase subunit PaaI n=1 Tax=Catellatospora chokoriensis TaxID=310353 RepID=A0A8J3NTV2_9ACTN|nr:1,2-phenylacetyl-CoA epoxidase subunit PaaC [Catellatospora chokoriensis]GIF90560.1 phenylacetate-CoA oxygenase subunit PaaI [Catellatospora chokoriensis]